jgi:hypothetical protein
MEVTPVTGAEPQFGVLYNLIDGRAPVGVNEVVQVTASEVKQWQPSL